VGASAAVMAAVSTVAAQQKRKQMQLTKDAGGPKKIP